MAAEIANDAPQDVQAPQQDLVKDVEDLQKEAEAKQEELIAEAAALLKQEATEAARKKLEEKLDKYLPDSAKDKVKLLMELKEKAESPEGQKKIERATQIAMAGYYAVQFLGEMVNILKIIFDDSSSKILNLGRLVISAATASLQACGAMNFTNKFLERKNSPMVERATQLHSYGKIAESLTSIPEASAKVFAAIKERSGPSIVLAARELAEACGQCATHMKVAADIMKDKMGLEDNGHIAQLGEMVMEFVEQAKRKLGLHRLENLDHDEILERAMRENGLGKHVDAIKAIRDEIPGVEDARTVSELVEKLRLAEDGAKSVTDPDRDDIKTIAEDKPPPGKERSRGGPRVKVQGLNDKSEATRTSAKTSRDGSQTRLEQEPVDETKTRRISKTAASTTTGEPLKAMEGIASEPGVGVPEPGSSAEVVEPSKRADLPMAVDIPQAKTSTPGSPPVKFNALQKGERSTAGDPSGAADLRKVEDVARIEEPKLDHPSKPANASKAPETPKTVNAVVADDRNKIGNPLKASDPIKRGDFANKDSLKPPKPALSKAANAFGTGNITRPEAPPAKGEKTSAGYSPAETGLTKSGDLKATDFLGSSAPPKVVPSDQGNSGPVETEKLRETRAPLILLESSDPADPSKPGVLLKLRDPSERSETSKPGVPQRTESAALAKAKDQIEADSEEFEVPVDEINGETARSAAPTLEEDHGKPRNSMKPRDAINTEELPEPENEKMTEILRGFDPKKGQIPVRDVNSKTAGLDVVEKRATAAASA